MPLAAFSMDPATAAHLRAIGLPNGPTTAPPDAATVSMGLNAALGASPMTNGSQTPPVTPQQNAQLASDTADIFGGMTPPQPQSTAPPAGQAARLQAAQSAMQPTAGQQSQVNFGAPDAMPVPQDAMPTPEQAKAATPGIGGIFSGALPAVGQSDVAKRLAAAQQAGGDPFGGMTPPQGPPQAASDSAASGPSPQLPVAGAGGPSGASQAPQATTPQATTPAASPQEAPQPSPVPGAAPVQQQAPQGLYTPSQIRAALIKQGVPEDDATKLTQISGAESGYGAHPVSGKNANGTTDYGVFQINSVHGDLNPSNLPNADLDTQAAAAAAVYKKEGLGAWTTYKNGAYQKFAGDGQGGGQGQFTGATSSNSLGSNSPPGAYSGIDAIKQGAEIGLDPKAMMSLAQSLGYKPIDTDAFNNRNLMAMGLAMMGGRTFADSMKNGAGVMNDSNNAMLGVQEKTNSNALQMAQLGINAKRADAQMALESRRADALDRPRPVGPPTQGADGKWNQMFLDPRTQTTSFSPTGTPAGFAASDPNRKAETTMAVEASKEQAHMLGSAGEDQAALQNIASARNVVQQHPELLGPTLGAQARRFAANMGIGDTATLQAYEKMSAEGRMNYLQEATGGHVGGIRSNAELENIGKAVASAQTDPKAADYLLGIQQRDIEGRQALRNTLTQNANKPEWTGKNYLTSQANFMTNYMQQHPVIFDSGQGTQPANDLSKFWTK